MASSNWFMQGQSLCILLLMIVGIIFRRKRTTHVRIMSGVIFWDILLILQIELSRSAILKASQALTNTLLLNIHVSLAIATVLLYGFMIYSGRALLAGQNKLRKRHRVLGYTTLSLRILTFITSFWATSPQA